MFPNICTNFSFHIPIHTHTHTQIHSQTFRLYTHAPLGVLPYKACLLHHRFRFLALHTTIVVSCAIEYLCVFHTRRACVWRFLLFSLFFFFVVLLEHIRVYRRGVFHTLACISLPSANHVVVTSHKTRCSALEQVCVYMCVCAFVLGIPV